MDEGRWAGPLSDECLGAEDGEQRKAFGVPCAGLGRVDHDAQVAARDAEHVSPAAGAFRRPGRGQHQQRPGLADRGHHPGHPEVRLPGVEDRGQHDDRAVREGVPEHADQRGAVETRGEARGGRVLFSFCATRLPAVATSSSQSRRKASRSTSPRTPPSRW